MEPPNSSSTPRDSAVIRGASVMSSEKPAGSLTKRWGVRTVVRSVSKISA